MTKKSRRFTREEIDKLDGVLVELNMPTSKYNRSILRVENPNNNYYPWIIKLSAPGLTRKLNVHYTKILKTTRKIEKLTSTPIVNKDVEFVDFSGYKFKIGDVLFGEGKLIRVIELNPTLCEAKVIHPTPTRWQPKILYHRAASMKNFLYIKDPTMVLLKT